MRKRIFGGLGISLILMTALASAQVTRGPISRGILSLLNCSADVTGLSGCTSSFPAIKRNAAALDVRLADDSNYANLNVGTIAAAGNVGVSSGASFRFNSVVFATNTAPSAPSACGTSPAVTSNNGTVAWVITGGTGGTATGCTVTMPTATTGWNCSVNNITASAAHRAGVTTVQTASTTTSVTFEYQTVSTGAATVFTASDVFRGICFAY